MGGGISDEKRDQYGLHYLGISFVLVWYYCLWFTPNVFTNVALSSNYITFSWLSTLACAGIAFLAIPAFLAEKKRLSDHPVVMKAACIILGIASFAFVSFDACVTFFPLSVGLFPVIFGACNAIIWITWGECYARQRATFSVSKFALVFGISMLIAIPIATFLPHILADIFLACIPLLCLGLYMNESKRIEGSDAPPLLPKATRQKTAKPTMVIFLAMFVACAACYFNIAIIPTDSLDLGDYTYPLSICAAALLCISVALAQKIFRKATTSYRTLPWFFLACAVGIALFVSSEEYLFTLSFVITTALAGLFEIFLVAYAGSLAAKGHLAPAFAFGVSSAAVRLGFFAGDSLAVVYEHNAFLADHFTQATSLLFLCLLVATLIPLIRQEDRIQQLTTAPARSNESNEVCDAIIAEFSLSKREGEILKFIARGYTIDNISKKLVISPYTTQTHVRHIYSKMHVHKRSELLDYINMHRNESVE